MKDLNLSASLGRWPTMVKEESVQVILKTLIKTIETLNQEIEHLKLHVHEGDQK